MSYVWIKAKTPGIRYREHPTRKHGVRFDRYFTIRYKLNGKVKEEALGWESQGWSERKAAERLFELKEAQRTGVGEKTLSDKRKASAERDHLKKLAEEKKARDGITFGNIFERYIEQASQDKGARTCVEERSRYKIWIEPAFKDKPLKDISPFLLEKLKKEMADNGKSPRTITYVLAVIRQVFNYAKNHDFFNGDNPVSKVKKPSEDNRRVRFLSYEEADSLLEELAKISPMLHNMALLSLHCGLRAGEIFNLEWTAVNLKNETLLIKDTKNGRNRNAIMTDDVRAMFESIIKNRESEIVFPSRRGAKTTEISRTFDRVVKKLGFNKGIKDRRQKVVFHTLRHTYASWLVISGIDLYTVQRLMGHMSISMTERYSHLAPDHLRKAVSRMESDLNKHRVIKFEDIERRA